MPPKLASKFALTNVHNCRNRPDGRRYSGGWLEGKQHGQSKYTNKDGVEKVGIWEYGKRQKWLLNNETPQ